MDVKTLIIGNGLAGFAMRMVLRDPQVTVIGPSAGQISGPFFFHKRIDDFPGEQRPIDVYQNVWDGKEFHSVPTIGHMNAHAMKVNGAVMETALRFMDGKPIRGYMPKWDILQNCARIYGEVVAIKDGGKRVTVQGTDGEFTEVFCDRIISTMPLPTMLEMLGVEVDHDWGKRPIRIKRFKATPNETRGAYQIVFPVTDSPIYRVSLMDGDISVESIDPVPEDQALRMVFSIWPFKHVTEAGEVTVKVGKFNPLLAEARKDLLGHLSQKFGVYSLGRYATWSYKRFEHVWDDAKTIERLINNPFHIH